MFGGNKSLPYVCYGYTHKLLINMTNGNTASERLDTTPKTEAEKQNDFRYKAAVLTKGLQKVIFKRVSEVEDPNEKMRLLNGQVAVSQEMLRLIG